MPTAAWKPWIICPSFILLSEHPGVLLHYTSVHIVIMFLRYVVIGLYFS